MKIHKVRSGYNIPIQGQSDPSAGIQDAPNPKNYTVRPVEFGAQLKPRLQVETGDTVKIGTTLFVDKRNPDIRYASPASGKISDIQYGPRRVIEAIVITPSGEDAEQFRNFRPGEIASAKREDLVKLLLEGGMWPYFRQRPYDINANPADTPASVFVNCMDTGPLAADPEIALQGKRPEFEAGVEGLKVLAGGNKVHVVVDGGKQKTADAQPLFTGIGGVEYRAFAGKHPAGLVGTHITQIDPIIGYANNRKVIWYLNARDVVKLGSFLLVGQYPTENVIAVAGHGVKADRRKYFRIRSGADIGSLLDGYLEERELRIISGNVLTGTPINKQQGLGFYDNLVTVLPEGRDRRFIGWLLPGFGRWTWSRAYMSAIIPGRRYAMDTNKNGEKRAIVKTGDYRKVMAIDVLPEFLIKAILAEDIEQMEALGIMECAPEDFALCAYICPSKIEFTEIVRDGLEMMHKELA